MSTEAIGPRGYGDTPSKEDMKKFDALPTVAQGRVRDFWGGVYKRFAVRGGRWYSVRIGRNHSYCTILSSIMLDRIPAGTGNRIAGLDTGEPDLGKYEILRDILREEFVGRRRDFLARFAPATSPEAAAERLMQELDWAYLRNPRWWLTGAGPFYAAAGRWYRDRLTKTASADDRASCQARLASCYHHLGLYPQWEAGLTLLDIPTPRSVEKAKRLDKERLAALGLDGSAGRWRP